METNLPPEPLIYLDELSQRLADIRQKLDTGEFVSPAIEGAYQRSAEHLTRQIADTVTTPEVQLVIASEAEVALRGIDEVEALEGILPNEEISELRTGFDKTVAVATELFLTYGAKTPEAQEFLVSLGSGAVAVKESARVVENVPVVPVAPKVEPTP